MLFSYQALQADGSRASGELNAADRKGALQQLHERGMRPVKLQQHAGKETGKPTTATLAANTRVSKAAAANFMRQLASLLSAGIPLARALEQITAETSSSSAKSQWQALHEQVIDGVSIADAMSSFPHTFPKVYVAMVRAGEMGGFLDVVLNQIAEFQEQEKELKGKVFSALAYPAALAIIATVVVVFLLVYFIPKFEGIFADFDAVLPLITRIVVGAGDLVTRYGLYTLGVLLVAGTLALRWLRSQNGQRAWEQFILRAPILGAVTSRFAMTRFCRMLGTLIGAGVPLLASLRVARESLGNQILSEAAETAISRLQQGGRLADSLAECNELFPGSSLEIISVAEQAGRLDEELIRLANTTEKELDRHLRMAVSLAEPVLLMVMAAVIGFIVVSMVLPIFSLQDYIK